MNKKLPAALCILLTIPIMVSATTYISIDIQDNKSVNNEKKDYPTPDRNKIIAFPGADGAGKYTTGGAGGTVYIEEFYKLKYCSTVVYMVPRA